MSFSLGFFSLRRPVSRGRSAFGSTFGSVSPPALELLELPEDPDDASSSFAAAAAAALFDTSSGKGLSLAASPGFCCGCWSASGAAGASAGWFGCCCCAARLETSPGNGFSSVGDLCAGGCFCCLLCAGGEDWLLESGVPDCCANAGSANTPATASSATERAIAPARNVCISRISIRV